MLSDVTYPLVSGTSVARDFVELPSQLYEHWLARPEVLRRSRVHCRDRRADAEGADRASCSPRATSTRASRRSSTLASALVDMELHLAGRRRPSTPMAFEAETLPRSACPRRSRCATARRISSTSSPATAIRPAITPTCGRRCWTPTPSRLRGDGRRLRSGAGAAPARPHLRRRLPASSRRRPTANFRGRDPEV